MGCAGNDACLVRPHSATDSIRKRLVSQAKLPMKVGKRRIGPRPPDSQFVLEPTGRFVPHNVSQALKKIGVNRTEALLENAIIGLRRDTQSRARVAALLAAVYL